MQKGQPDIFSNTRQTINYLLARVVANHGYSKTEADWRVTMVNSSDIPEENEVHFIVSQKVRVLIEEQYNLDVHDDRKGEMDFVCIKESAIWRISVKASGVESFYFARMLFYGVNKLARKQRDKDVLNCKLINMYITFARAKTMGLPKKIRIDSENNKYTLSSGAGNNAWNKSLDNIDDLCAYIGRRFKGYVEL